MKKTFRFFFAAAAITLLPFILLDSPGAQSKKEAAKPAAASASNTYEMLNLFGDVFERVKSDYVEEVPDSKLIENALNGMLSSLDPHSSYLNEKSFKDMQVQTKGEFGGLGIEVTMENGLVKVVSPIDDTPAYKAGVLTGDYISHIDDEPVMGMSLADAVEKMRGPAGSTVKVTLLRDSLTEPLDLTITRAVISIKPVRARAEKDIIYLRITSFSDPTYDNMKSEFERLKKEIGTPRGVVLDLRNNPGGLLDQAIAVSDAFIDSGEIVSTRGRNPADAKRFSAHAGDITGNLPMVVLINSGSASASEIVAGALQDHKRAIIMGTKSFGKGSVQTVIPLPGHGAIRLTTSRYFTPSGHSIQAKGIVPDILVEQAKVEAVKSERERLEADLRGRLENPEDETNKDKKPAEKEGKEKKEEILKKINELKKQESDKKDDGKTKAKQQKQIGELSTEEDFQLMRALDLLHGLTVYKQLQAN